VSEEREAEVRDGPTQLQYVDNHPHLVVRSAKLRIVSGPEEGKSVPIELTRVSVGSASDNDLVLSDTMVSRRHLQIQVRESGYLLQDMGSTNGTFFRGARISEALVGHGAEFRLGKTVLRVEAERESSSVVTGQSRFGRLIGTSPAMQEVYGVLTAVAPTDATVMITGETGTGKELVAEEIHHQSARCDQPLVVVDCASIPEGLIEAELFGYERGAFTGADEARPGAFERADRGTVFLDEIGDLPLEMQTRLLRVLDKRTVRRVGSAHTRKVDIRVIAATHRPLIKMVQEDVFRQDLYFRLSVVAIRLPALRERTADIPLLARHFLWQAGCPNPDQVLQPQVVQMLSSRRWRGNVRELRNVIERATVFADGAQPGLSQVEIEAEEGAEAGPAPPEQMAAEAEQNWLDRSMPGGFLDQPYKEAKDQLLGQFESLYFEHVSSQLGQNITRIASAAQVDRHLVRILMRKHGLLPSK